MFWFLFLGGGLICAVLSLYVGRFKLNNVSKKAQKWLLILWGSSWIVAIVAALKLAIDGWWGMWMVMSLMLFMLWAAWQNRKEQSAAQ